MGSDGASSPSRGRWASNDPGGPCCGRVGRSLGPRRRARVSSTPHSFFAALALIEPGRWGRIALQIVIERHASPSEDKTAILSPTAIAKPFGGCRQSANRDIQALVRSKIIVRQGLGYALNVDHREWLDDDGKNPRFGETDLAWIAGAKRRVMEDSPASAPALTDQPPSSEPRQRLRLHTEAPALTDQPEDMDECKRRRLQSEAPALTNAASPPDPPYMELRTEEPNTPPNPPEPLAVGVGGSVHGRKARDYPFPIPDGFEEVCRKADNKAVDIKSLKGFGDKLRDEWQTNGKLQAWWGEFPDPVVWGDALNDFAGVDEDKRHPGYFIGIARKRCRDARNDAKRDSVPPSQTRKVEYLPDAPPGYADRKIEVVQRRRTAGSVAR